MTKGVYTLTKPLCIYTNKPSVYIHTLTKPQTKTKPHIYIYEPLSMAKGV